MKKGLLVLLLLVCGYYSRAGSDMVHVYRWYIPQDKTYTIVTEGQYTDSELVGRGWTGKVYLFDGYTTPGDGRVAVYGWVNPTNKQQVSVNDREFTDEQMKSKGFTGKKLQYYAASK